MHVALLLYEALFQDLMINSTVRYKIMRLYDNEKLIHKGDHPMGLLR